MKLRMTDKSDTGAAPLPPESEDQKRKRERDGKKRGTVPTVHLHFVDVSNDCDGDYPTQVERGEPAPRDDLWDAVRRSVGSESSGIHAHALKAINTAVAEFLSK